MKKQPKPCKVLKKLKKLGVVPNGMKKTTTILMSSKRITGEHLDSN